MNYIDFTVTIQNQQTIKLVCQEGTYPELPLQVDEIAQLTVERMNAWVNFGLKQQEATTSQQNPVTVDDLKVIGLNLYRILFTEQVRKSFKTDYEQFAAAFAQNPALRFRLKLVFTKAAEPLSRLPWEFLFIPGEANPQEGFFFAGDQTQLILTRNVPRSHLIAQLKAAAEGLRILVIISSPKIGAVELTSQSVDRLLDEMRNLKNAQIKILEESNCTVDNVDGWFGDGKFNPHVVHFIGHGEAGKLAFVKALKDLDYDERIGGLQPRWVTGEELREMVRNWYPRPRLIFLHACKGAAATSHDTFNSCARELVYADVPVVVAMQYSIANEEAALFAKTFYAALGSGRGIDEAVKAGRLELGKLWPRWRHPRFGTPVVYLQADDPLVLPAADTEERPVETPGSVPGPATSRVGATFATVTARRTTETVTTAPTGGSDRDRTGFEG